MRRPLLVSGAACWVGALADAWFASSLLQISILFVAGALLLCADLAVEDDGR